MKPQNRTIDWIKRAIIATEESYEKRLLFLNDDKERENDNELKSIDEWHSQLELELKTRLSETTLEYPVKNEKTI